MLNRRSALPLLVAAATAAGLCAGRVHAEAAATDTAAPYAKAGFVTAYDKDGRLWVFREGSKEQQE